MKKTIIVLILFLLVNFTLSGCSTGKYYNSKRESTQIYSEPTSLSEIFPTGIYQDYYQLDSLYLEEIGEDYIVFLLDSIKPNSSLYSLILIL